MKEIPLPSGATLRIHEAPIEASYELYQTILAEVADIDFNVDKEAENLGVESLIKDVLCRGYSSKKVHAAASACFSKCLYNDEKLDMRTFDPADRRQDLVPVLTAVVEENIAPFAKGLFAVFATYQGLAQSTRIPQ
jgi:hypothetical protein